MQVKQSAKALLADARNVALAKTLLRYGTAAYVMGVTNDLADARGTLLPDGYAPLPDLGFDYIPFMPGLGWLADSLVKALYVLVFLRIFLSAHRRVLACTFIELHASLMLLRCLTVALTVLPAPQRICTYKLAEPPSHFLIEPLRRMLRPDGMSSWCHDMLFSGHTVFFTLAALFLHDSGGHWAWRATGWIGAFAGITILLGTRTHYSVDVTVAIIITFLVYLQWRVEVVRGFAERRR